ncbi:MAG: hypothetical protein LBR31_09345 [Desulfovibrio sp.]|jgi:uncharacterized protein HemX|nr:hypothetical protein [Desulfovibrio sp.]
MTETIYFAVIGLFVLLELIVLGGIFFFFSRLKRSETLLNALQGNQDALLARIETNARLEREIVASFAQRQAELRNLDEKLEERAKTLRRLVEQADEVRRSPRFLREIIQNGRRKGLTCEQIAKNAGLGVDEVELILAQEANNES